MNDSVEMSLGQFVEGQFVPLGQFVERQFVEH